MHLFPLCCLPFLLRFHRLNKLAPALLDSVLVHGRRPRFLFITCLTQLSSALVRLRRCWLVRVFRVGAAVVEMGHGPGRQTRPGLVLVLALQAGPAPLFGRACLSEPRPPCRLLARALNLTTQAGFLFSFFILVIVVVLVDIGCTAVAVIVKMG